MRPEEAKRLRTTAAKLIRISAATLFGISALMKLTGYAPFVHIFSEISRTPSLRYVVGSAELAGAILVLIRGRTLAGGVVLLCVSVSAIIHVTMMGEAPFPLLVGTALAVAVMFIELRKRRASLPDEGGGGERNDRSRGTREPKR